MIDFDLVIAQVQSLGIFRSVQGAVEAAAVMDGKISAGDGPNAYVVPLADAPGTPQSMVPVQQVVTSSLGILIMVRGAGDPTGYLGIPGLTTLRRQLRDGLTGWQPATDFEGMWWSNGRLLDFAPGTLWWIDAYSTRYGFVQEGPIFR